jgi:hypothetical protein
MGQQLNAFWGELSPCEHFVQVYDEDTTLLDKLADFIGTGLKQGHAAVVILTQPHRDGLDSRLEAMELDIPAAKANDCYICVDAEQILHEFMVDGWPDESRFRNAITNILNRAARNGRKVLAFGEIVAVLWARGECGATVRLEHFWTNLCQEMSFKLFCAYPKSGFTADANESLAEICAAHSKVLKA